MVLVDTSLWVSYLRGGSRSTDQHLDRLLELGEVVVCGPVLAELIAGAQGERREAISGTLGSLPWAELDHTGWQMVGILAGALRAAGESLPLTDLVIAVGAAEGGHSLWSLDTDFQRIGAVFDALDLYSPPGNR